MQAVRQHVCCIRYMLQHSVSRSAVEAWRCMTLLDYSPSLKQRTRQVAGRQVHNGFKLLKGRQLVCAGTQGARSSILVKR